MNKIFGSFTKIHFVGIGGIGMSGIAEILHSMGYVISGSDVSDNANVQRLRSIGITVYVGHDASNVKDVDVVVYTSAVDMNNPELAYAYHHHIPFIKRGEMLGELTRMKYTVSVTGAHGKTTTSSIISELLTVGELDPTVVIGGRLNRTNNNAFLGKGNVMVVEADESDRSFLYFYPTIAIITNIDYEHVDQYSDIEDIKDCFVQYANKVPFYGKVVLCIDDENVASIIPRINKRIITYGIKNQASVRARDIQLGGFSSSFNVEVFGVDYGRVELNLAGIHNVLNSLAAIATAFALEVPFEKTKLALREFGGVQRRLSVRYRSEECVVLDDYGHHPTEIVATLRSVREAYNNSRIVVYFQPHRYTRTQALLDSFARCFYDSDDLYILDIYPGSEKPIPGINSESLAKLVQVHGHKHVQYVGALGGAVEHFKSWYGTRKSGNDEKYVVITLGAGDVTSLSVNLAKHLTLND